MPIDISQFSSTVIEGLEEDQQSWKPPDKFPPPPDPGAYRVFIKKIRSSNEKMTPHGKRMSVCFDLEILDPGSFQGRILAFQWAGNYEYKTEDRGRTSGLLDLIQSAGVKTRVSSNADFAGILNQMEDNPSKAFKVLNDWRGSCRSCFEDRIKLLTGQDSREAAMERLTPEQKAEANKFALKFANARQFPLVGTGNKRKASVECNDCGETIRAQANVVRYLTE